MSLRDAKTTVLKLALVGVGLIVRRSKSSLLAGDPVISSGDDAPDADEPDGSLYLRSTGALYLRAASAWAEILPGSGSSSVSLRVVSSLPAAALTTDEVVKITAAGTFTLLAPTSGRQVVIKAKAAVALATASGQIEGPTGALAATLPLADGDSVRLIGDGSNWLILA